MYGSSQAQTPTSSISNPLLKGNSRPREHTLNSDDSFCSTPSQYSQFSYVYSNDSPRNAFNIQDESDDDYDHDDMDMNDGLVDDDQSRVLTITGTLPSYSSTALGLTLGASLPFALASRAMGLSNPFSSDRDAPTRSDSNDAVSSHSGHHPFQPLTISTEPLPVPRQTVVNFANEPILQIQPPLSEEPKRSATTPAVDTTTISASKAERLSQQRLTIDLSHLRDIYNKLLTAAKTPFDGRIFGIHRFSSSSRVVSGGVVAPVEAIVSEKEELRETVILEKSPIEEEEEGQRDLRSARANFYAMPSTNFKLRSTLSFISTSTIPAVDATSPPLTGNEERYLSSSGFPEDSQSERDFDTFMSTRSLPPVAPKRGRPPTPNASQLLERISPSTQTQTQTWMTGTSRLPRRPATATGAECATTTTTVTAQTHIGLYHSPSFSSSEFRQRFATIRRRSTIHCSGTGARAGVSVGASSNDTLPIAPSFSSSFSPNIISRDRLPVRSYSFRLHRRPRSPGGDIESEIQFEGPLERKGWTHVQMEDEEQDRDMGLERVRESNEVARPEEVLARDSYNHNQPSTSSSDKESEFSLTSSSPMAKSHSSLAPHGGANSTTPTTSLDSQKPRSQPQVEKTLKVSSEPSTVKQSNLPPTAAPTVPADPIPPHRNPTTPPPTPTHLHHHHPNTTPSAPEMSRQKSFTARVRRTFARIAISLNWIPGTGHHECDDSCVAPTSKNGSIGGSGVGPGISSESGSGSSVSSSPSPSPSPYSTSSGSSDYGNVVTKGRTLVKKSSLKRNHSGEGPWDERWVWVEVMHTVTQHVLVMPA